jgi:hypothetical protein
MSASRVLCGVFALAAVAAIAACGGSEPQPATTIGHALDYRRNASTGYLYVANESGYGPSGTGSILIFSESANGNVAPLDVISGSATGLSQSTASRSIPVAKSTSSTPIRRRSSGSLRARAAT